MQHTLELNETDLRKLIAAAADVECDVVDMDHCPALDDGPGRHSPATVSVVSVRPRSAGRLVEAKPAAAG